MRASGAALTRRRPTTECRGRGTRGGGNRADGRCVKRPSETVWREAEGPGITLRDAAAAEELVNDELDRRFFRDRYEKATEAETIYMAAMADLGDGGHSSTDIAAHMRMSQRELSVRRAGLIDKGLIYSPIGTRLDFTVPVRGVSAPDPSLRSGPAPESWSASSPAPMTAAYTV